MLKDILFRTLPAIVLSGSLLVVAVTYAAVWTEPTQDPPGGNVAAPLTVGDVTQRKSGALGVGGLFRAEGTAIFDSRVGIGTTNPDMALRISASGGNTARFNNSGNTSWLYFNANNGTDVILGALNSTGDFQVQTGGSGRLTITSAGNVGIGTVAPTARLDIDGTIRIRGGSPGAGRVLTSNADGTATWEANQGGGFSSGVLGGACPWPGRPPIWPAIECSYYFTTWSISRCAPGWTLIRTDIFIGHPNSTGYVINCLKD